MAKKDQDKAERLRGDRQVARARWEVKVARLRRDEAIDGKLDEQFVSRIVEGQQTEPRRDDVQRPAAPAGRGDDGRGDGATMLALRLTFVGFLVMLGVALMAFGKATAAGVVVLLLMLGWAAVEVLRRVEGGR